MFSRTSGDVYSQLSLWWYTRSTTTRLITSTSNSSYFLQ